MENKKEKTRVFVKVCLLEPLTPDEQALYEQMLTDGDIIWKPGKSPDANTEESRAPAR